jgi:hypothetical protein
LTSTAAIENDIKKAKAVEGTGKRRGGFLKVLSLHERNPQPPPFPR